MTTETRPMEPCGFHEMGDPACACQRVTCRCGATVIERNWKNHTYRVTCGPHIALGADWPGPVEVLREDEERAIREDALDPRTRGLSVGMVRRLLATLDAARALPDTTTDPS